MSNKLRSMRAIAMFTVQYLNLKPIKPPLYPSKAVPQILIFFPHYVISIQFHPWFFFLQNVLAKQAVHQTLFMIYSHNSSVNVLYGRVVFFPSTLCKRNALKCAAILKQTFHVNN